MLEHSVVSTIGPGGPYDETGSVVDAPGDAIVVSSECREIDRGTLDIIRICRVDPQSESKMCCGSSCSIIFDEGVFGLDLCPPGIMCKLRLSVIKPVLCCVPRRMAYYQPGAAGSLRHTGILLGTGRNSFSTMSECHWLFLAGICTGYVLGSSAGTYP